MLRWALIFLVVALIAGAFNFIGVEGAALQIARILFFVFLVLFVLSLIAGRRMLGGNERLAWLSHLVGAL